MAYEHRQIGWVTAGPFLLLAFVALPLARLRVGSLAFVPALVVLTIVVLFGWLTVTVDPREVKLRFGVGVFRKRVPFDAIRDCRVVRNKWYYGWGIRLTPRGWLWNVAGLDGIELDLSGDRHFRIGTNDPQGLLAAIRRVMPGQPARR